MMLPIYFHSQHTGNICFSLKWAGGWRRWAGRSGLDLSSSCTCRGLVFTFPWCRRKVHGAGGAVWYPRLGWSWHLPQCFNAWQRPLHANLSNYFRAALCIRLVVLYSFFRCFISLEDTNPRDLSAEPWCLGTSLPRAFCIMQKPNSCASPPKNSVAAVPMASSQVSAFFGFSLMATSAGRSPGI